MKIICRTLFDCSYTGVTGHFRVAQLPFVDKAGQIIRTEEAWHHSRNQQRNWETLIQVISLKTQPLDMTRPVKKNDTWEFEFTADNPGVFSSIGNTDPVAGLLQDFEGVPMLTKLNEEHDTVSTITTSGSGQNIWLEAINNILD
jgi:hypothetical protein